LDEQSALKAADMSLERGFAMTDAIVYSTARAYSAQLITSDKNLKQLPGVQYIE
jgi:predicted nucleic acid-binding protein